MTEKSPWKEGVELFLDNRQIFMLFFACAVILSLVFALGVVVGKRAEPSMTAQQTTDPLALLDQVGGKDKPDENLSFHEELAGAKTSQPNDPIANIRQKASTSKEDAEREPSKSKNERDNSSSKKSTKAAIVKKLSAKKQKRAVARAEDNKTGVKKGVLHKSTRSQKGARSDSKSQSNAEVALGKFSLQLSSFQDPTEAKKFMRKLKTAGMKPYLVPAKIPGRGIWFRVRLGAYSSWEEALAAKKVFERNQQMIAYVAKN